MKGNKVKLITTLILLGVLVVIGLTGFFEVKQGEQAVVLTFGRISDSKQPGLYWHIPLIQTVKKQSTTVLYTQEYGFRTVKTATTTSQSQYTQNDNEAIMLTGDQNIVRVEAVYQVMVQDVRSFFFKVDDQFGTMQCAFEAVLRRNLQNRTLDEALLSKQDIETQVLSDFREMLKPYDMGVVIKDVKIQNISVPDEVKAAYEDVNNAKNEKTQKLDEAEKYKNQTVPNARGQAYKLEQDAQAYQARTVAEAQGEVAKFNDIYAKYKNSKDITRQRLLIETLESILAAANKLYIMDDSSGALKLLNLNDTAAPTPAATPQPTAAPTATPQPTATAGGK